MNERALITGIGVVSPLGIGVRATLDAVANGRRAAAAPSVFGADSFSQPNGAEVRDFDPRPFFRVPKALKLTDRAARFAVAAAHLALEDASAADGSMPPERFGVVIGSSGSDLQAPALGAALAGLSEGEVDDVRQFGTRILGGLNPLWLLVNLPNMTSAHVAIQFNARGPNSTVMSDWAAGLQAIGEAAEWIRGGEADTILAGGSDSGLMPFAYASFEQAGLMSGPDGFVPAEGAAMFVIESSRAATARGARVHGEVKAYASAAATSDDPDALAAALGTVMCRAVTMADWDPRTIAVAVCPAAIGSPLEPVQALALERAFGRQAEAVRRVTFEPWLGHALAAAAPIDLALTLALGAPGDAPARILCGAVGPTGQAVALAAERAS